MHRSTNSFPVLGRKIIQFVLPFLILSKLTALSRSWRWMLTITQHPSAPAFLRHTFQFTKYMLFIHVIPRQLAAPTDRHVKYKRLIWRALTWGHGHRRNDLNSYSGWRWTTFLKMALCVCPTPPYFSLSQQSLTTLCLIHHGAMLSKLLKVIFEHYQDYIETFKVFVITL